MIAAVITTRNEAGTIGRLVDALYAHADRVIVADADSTDDTLVFADMHGAAVFHVGRVGIGPALRQAWTCALDFGATRILQIDAGGSHDPHEAPRLLDVDADMVIGSRFTTGGVYVGRPWRAWLSRAAAAALNTAQPGARYADWTSGYRVFSADLARYLLRVPYQCEMHGWQIEVLARAGEAGARIVEVPITYRAGRSSFNLKIAGEGFQAYSQVANHIGWIGSRLHEEGLS